MQPSPEAPGAILSLPPRSQVCIRELTPDSPLALGVAGRPGRTCPAECAPDSLFVKLLCCVCSPILSPVLNDSVSIVDVKGSALFLVRLVGANVRSAHTHLCSLCVAVDLPAHCLAASDI